MNECARHACLSSYQMPTRPALSPINGIDNGYDIDIDILSPMHKNLIITVLRRCLCIGDRISQYQLSIINFLDINVFLIDTPTLVLISIYIGSRLENAMDIRNPQSGVRSRTPPTLASSTIRIRTITRGRCIFESALLQGDFNEVSL